MEPVEVWGATVPDRRAPRILGVFAHPDDEVFCMGGTIARCAEAGAVTGTVSLTEGEAGQIRDSSTATRSTLGAVRAKELMASATALGVDEVTCLDLGDGHLDERPLAELATTVTTLIEEFQPDVVVTFGPDGGTGHPDHVRSCFATLEAVRSLPAPPRLLHARFTMGEELLVDLLVEWLTSNERRFDGTKAFGHALKLFADGTSLLGVAADHLAVEWYPAGSFIIEQGEPATQLFCLLSGSADVVIQGGDGGMTVRDTIGAGCFVGEDGLATGRPRNAHVIARDDVTCLVLAAGRPDRAAGRGAGAGADVTPARRPRGPSFGAPSLAAADRPGHFSVDVRPSLDRKVAALAAHRSQYALEPDLFPRSVLERLLGIEHFTVVEVPR